MLNQVVIVGCGLIGGSLVKALRARGAVRRLAVVDRAEVLAEAHGFVDRAALPDSTDATSLVSQADLVVLAAPPDAIAGAIGPTLDRLRDGAVLTDTGSVKR